MQVFACLPKAQGLAQLQPSIAIAEFHRLITPDYQNDSKKSTTLISEENRISHSITPIKVAKQQEVVMKIGFWGSRASKYTRSAVT